MYKSAGKHVRLGRHLDLVGRVLPRPMPKRKFKRIRKKTRKRVRKQKRKPIPKPIISRTQERKRNKIQHQQLIKLQLARATAQEEVRAQAKAKLPH